MKKNIKKFTLIELITAMAIFTLLMVVMMQFFSAAQQAWTKSSQRSMVYDNARIALDLITRDLQCAYYIEDEVPFWHSAIQPSATEPSPENEMLAFISTTSIRPNTYCTTALCEIKYQLYYTVDPVDANAGWLMRSVTGNRADNGTSEGTPNSNWNFQGSPPNFDVGPSGGTRVFTKNNNSSGDFVTNVDFTKIIPYVTEFSFICFKNDIAFYGTTDTGVFTLNDPGFSTRTSPFPDIVKIEISLLDKDSWNKWIAFGGRPDYPLHDPASELAIAKEFRDKHERTFTKMIFMGERMQ